MTLRSTSLVALAVIALMLAAAASYAQKDAKKNQTAANDDPIGYFLGVSVGQTMVQQGFKSGDFKPAALAAGVADALAQREPSLTDEQLQEAQGRIQALLQGRQKEVQKRQEAMLAELKKQAVVNKEKSDLWLKKNAAKEGVKSLEGGLQYKVIKSGKGGSPSAADTVKVHYTGKLITGQVFDSSVERGEPIELSLAGPVIKGWKVGLPKMKVGDKWMLYIPPDLGYGEQGRPGKIGPNEVLVFEIELLDII